MVTVEQIRCGLLRYADSEFIEKIPGLAKWGAAWAVNRKVDQYLQNQNYLKDMGYMHEDGMVDIDMLYEDFHRIAEEKGKVTEHFPILEDVTFSADDISKLYHAIVG